MSKEELIKKYQEIVLKTNGGIEDYVVALCHIANAINELEDTTDLQNQLAELKAENERLLSENGYLIFADGYDENDKPINRQIYKTYKQSNEEFVTENKKLIRQLKEKDEEIEKLQRLVKCWSDECERKFTLLQDNTHDICEKIRKEVEKEKQENDLAWIGFKKLNRILDQLEKGKK